jgi:hypothetical protein
MSNKRRLDVNHTRLMGLALETKQKPWFVMHPALEADGV